MNKILLYLVCFFSINVSYATDESVDANGATSGPTTIDSSSSTESGDKSDIGTNSDSGNNKDENLH